LIEEAPARTVNFPVTSKGYQRCLTASGAVARAGRKTAAARKAGDTMRTGVIGLAARPGVVR
jgi:hypothetical protein